MTAKNELQELLHKCHLDTPRYREEENTGPSHSPCFACSVTVNLAEDVLVERGQGRKKKEAEKDAATNMLERLKEMGMVGGAPGVVRIGVKVSSVRERWS